MRYMQKKLSEYPETDIEIIEAEGIDLTLEREDPNG